MTRGVQDDGRLITRIHGKYYDLTSFEFVHPGGRTALNCARDRDGTGLFESYHLLSIDKARKTLAAYEIADGSFDNDTRFLDVKKFGDEVQYDWSPTTAGAAFRRDIVDMCTTYFEQEYTRRGFKPGTPLYAATKAPPQRQVEIVVFGLAWIAACYWMITGSWAGMCLTPLTGWIFCVNYWHGE
jgi:hypothetical protein